MRFPGTPTEKGCLQLLRPHFGWEGEPAGVFASKLGRTGIDDLGHVPLVGNVFSNCNSKQRETQRHFGPKLQCVASFSVRIRKVIRNSV